MGKTIFELSIIGIILLFMIQLIQVLIPMSILSPTKGVFMVKEIRMYEMNGYKIYRLSDTTTNLEFWYYDTLDIKAGTFLQLNLK